MICCFRVLEIHLHPFLYGQLHHKHPWQVLQTDGYLTRTKYNIHSGSLLEQMNGKLTREYIHRKQTKTDASPTAASSLQLLQTLTNPDCFGQKRTRQLYFCSQHKEKHNDKRNKHTYIFLIHPMQHRQNRDIIL